MDADTSVERLLYGAYTADIERSESLGRPKDPLNDSYCQRNVMTEDELLARDYALFGITITRNGKRVDPWLFFKDTKETEPCLTTEEKRVPLQPT